jgi:hypothetical protein
LVILTDVVSECITFSEAPLLARKCGTIGVTVLIGLCNPPCRGCGEPAKPRLLYPLVGYLISDLESWVTCCDR